MEIICETRPKARKEHRCDFCALPIKKGNTYKRQVAKIDDVYTWKAHLHCDELAGRLGLYKECCWDEGVTADYFREGVREYLRSKLQANRSDWPSELKIVLNSLEIKEDGVEARL